MRSNKYNNPGDIQRRIEHLKKEIKWKQEIVDHLLKFDRKPNEFLEESIKEHLREIEILQDKLACFEGQNVLFY